MNSRQVFAELSNDEIYEKVFKKKPSVQSVDVPMPLMYNDQERPMGMLNTKTGETANDLLIESDPLFVFLNKAVEGSLSEYKSKEIKKSDGQKWIPISAFQKAGFKIVYNSSKLDLHLIVPPELRKIKTISLSRLDQGYDGEAPLAPNLLSAYVNMIGSQMFVDGVSSQLDGRQPLRGFFESGLNMASWVLESSVTYVENENDIEGFPSWQRGDVRLVKDYQGWVLRQTIGDLNYPLRDYQVFKPMAGVSIGSQFGLQPYRLTVPGGNYELFLKRPSRVVVYINDQQRQILDLPAGMQNLKDFPFSLGLNDLRLEITNDLGQTETVFMSYFSNNELLKPGIHQLNYAAGVPSSNLNSERTYDTSTVTTSIFHRYGVSEVLTLGANLQMDKTQYVAGAEVLLSTKIGFFKLVPALSSHPTGGLGSAVQLRYLYSDFGGPEKSQRSMGLGVENKTSKFSPFTTLFTPVAAAYDFTAHYSQALTLKTRAQASLGYQLNRKSDTIVKDSYRLGLGVNSYIDNGLSIAVNVAQSRSSNNVNDASVSFFLTWAFPQDRQFVTASYNPKSDSARAAWNAQPKTNFGTGVQAGLDKTADIRGFDGRVQNTNSRSILSLANRSQWSPDKTNPAQFTTAQVSTALVYAGGHVGLTRPVADSFLIVSPENSAKGQTIEINPQRNGVVAAKTDFLMNDAILPELPSYNYVPIVVGTEKLKIGTSIDQDHFMLYPTYKSGYVIEVGSKASVAISVILVGADGLPITMQPGEAKAIGAASADGVITVFTGRNGEMRAQGFWPGKFTLRLFDEKWEPVTFEIPARTTGIYEMGKLKLNLRKK